MNIVNQRVAITGLGVRASGCTDPNSFWQLRLRGEPRFQAAPLERWDPESHALELPEGHRDSIPRVCLIENFSVDWKSLRLPPLQVERMHRMERMALACMSAALVDAGFDPSGGPHERARVFVASTTLGRDPLTDHGRRIRRHQLQAPVSTAIAHHLAERAQEVDEIIEMMFNLAAPPVEPDSLTTSASVLAGRIANIFDLRGGHYGVDAGACSSLAALARGHAAIARGEADIAVVCGLSPLVTANTILGMAHAAMLGTARPMPFAPSSSGALPGEGAIAVVLASERYLEGRSAGPPHAWLDGIGSFHAVSRDARALAAATQTATQRALQDAGVDPGALGHVASAACGVSEFDRPELEGLARALAAEQRAAPVRVASGAGQFGALGPARGMLALLEATLALSHRRWPGQPGHAPVRLDGLVVGDEPVLMTNVERIGVSDVGIDPLAFHAILSAPDTTPRGRRARSRPSNDDAIAIVGMGAFVPGAQDVAGFWSNVLEGIDAIGDLPRSRWDVDAMVGSDPHLGELLETRLAGVVDLETLVHRHPDVRARDPAILLGLEVTGSALADARLHRRALDPERAGVVFGQLPLRLLETRIETRLLFASYLQLAANALAEAEVGPERVAAIVRAARAQFDRAQPDLLDEAFLGQSGHALARAIADAFHLRGEVLCIDAACASSLAAVEVATEHLRAGAADLMVAGGVAYNLFPEYYMSLSMLGALSPRGVPPFHMGADGFVPAEGAAAVALVRLDDAVKAGHRVYAVLRGLGRSSDGRGLSVYAPNPRGQQLAIERGLRASAMSSDQVDYVEAHGTGTALGDEVELDAYAKSYGSRVSGSPLILSTAKAKIGHTSGAAGLVGLVKAALALHHRVIPPGLDSCSPCHEALEHGSHGSASLALSDLPRAWIKRDGPRCAGVSAFGLGGVNYHAVLSEFDAHADRPAQPGLEHPTGPPPRGPRASRFEVELVPKALERSEQPVRIAGKTLAVIFGAASAPGDALVRALEHRGARAVPLDLEQACSLNEALQARRVSRLDGIIDASTFGAAAMPTEARLEEHTTRTFALAKAAVARLEDAPPGSGVYVAVTSLGGDLGLLGCDEGNVLGAHLCGLTKALRQEFPTIRTKTIDFDPTESPAEVAERVIQEIESGDERVEVGYAGRRYVTNLRLALHRPDAPVLRDPKDGDVFVFSGGGRGVVYECALALAQLGVQVVVTGRTPPPAGDEPWLALDDEAFAAYRLERMRQMRQDDRRLTPVAFAHEFAWVERQRELASNLRRAETLGLHFEYQVCDIDDARAVATLVQRVRSEHGRITGVVHGAMVEWSKALFAKSEPQIRATTRAKVVGLENLVAAVVDDPPDLFMAFGSGAGRFGNRGQSDYAAANALMAAALQAHSRSSLRRSRCITLNWTAWAEVGAAVANRDIAQRVEETGVTSISTQEGVYWFLSEVALGSAAEVVIFEERMLHRWPGLGEQPERQVKASPFDDRRRPLVPGSWPMLDSVRRLDTGTGVTFRRRLALERDPFLAHHRLHKDPILPATFGCELVAEAARACAPDWEVVALRDVEIETPAKLHRGRSLELRGSARVCEDVEGRRIIEVETRSDLLLRGRVLKGDRLHHRARVVLARQRRSQSRAFPDLGARARLHSRSIFVQSSDPVELGPTFTRAQWIRVADFEVTGTIRPPRQRDVFEHTTHPLFQADPFAMDTAFQIAANWDGYVRGFVSVPMGIAEIELFRARRRNETARVHARVLRIEDPDVHYDVTMFAQDEDEVIMHIRGLHLRRVGPVKEQS